MTGNVLFSYAYCNRPLNHWIKTYGEPWDILIDSGAHSVHNSGGHIELDDYCDWLEEYGPHVTRYIQLDVIGNAAATKVNLKAMRDRGFDPMPVLTCDVGAKAALELLRNSKKPELCIAGGAGNVDGAQSKMDNGMTWYENRCRMVRKVVGKDVWIHGLGYTRGIPKMTTVPINSFDSSSHTHAARSGSIILWDRRNMNTKNVYLKYGSASKVQGRTGNVDVRHWGVLEPWIKQTLLSYGLTPARIAALSGHRGHWTGLHVISHAAFCEAAYLLRHTTGQVLYLANNYLQQMITQHVAPKVPGPFSATDCAAESKAFHERHKREWREALRA